MKQWKKVISIFMSGALLITGGILPQKSSVAAEGADYGISSPRIEKGVTTWGNEGSITTWDKIKFGSYYQDAEVQPEPIKWRVLSVDGDDAFLLADKILDAKPYHDGWEDITWEDCALRKWLNEDFYNEAFDEEEKEAVIKTTVVNDNNPEYGTAGGNETNDNVYLLSIGEAGNAAYGFDTAIKEGYSTATAWRANNTDYAIINNAYNDDGYGDWWLRSPGEDNTQALCVWSTGSVFLDGSPIGKNEYGVRPVLHVNLSSPKVRDAGEVDSEGSVSMSDNGIDKPTVQDGVTTWDCVYFGNYRQSCKFEKQPLEWRVLSVDEDDAFLLADKVIDAKPYHDGWDTTWKNCTLRKWLNEDFYNEAFDAEEKKAVKETGVVNDNNPEYDTEGGDDTKDKVYLLSIAEACSAEFGFDTVIDNYWSDTRLALCTDYAKVNGISYYDTDKSSWWLRSPGNASDRAAYVSILNEVSISGGYAGISTNGVRPVLHIDLSSAVWSEAGQISAEIIEVDNPTDPPEETDQPTDAPEITKEPEETDQPTDAPEVTKEPEETDQPTATPEVTKKPEETDQPTKTPEVTKEPEHTDQPTATPKVTKEPEQTANPDEPRFYAEDVTAEPGSEIEIPIKISKNTGIMGLGINVGFDKDVLTPIDDVKATSLLAGQFNNSIEGTLRDGKDSFKVLWQGTDEMMQDGVLFTLKFRVDSGMTGDTDIVLTLIENETFDEQYENVHVNCSNIKVTAGHLNPSEPTNSPHPDNTQTPEVTKKPEETERPVKTPEVTEKPTVTEQPTATPEATREPEETIKPTTVPEPTNEPSEPTNSPQPAATDNPSATQTPEPTQKPDVTQAPEPTQKPDVTERPSETQDPGTQNPAIQNPVTQNPILQNPSIQPSQNIGSNNNTFTVAPGDTTELTAPAKVKLKSVKASGKKKLKVLWKWISGQNGYQIQYATNSKFTKNKKTANASKDAAEKILKGLKSKKKYYVRIRAYKFVAGKKYYGAWSNIKKCKVK